jgi:hypothetical protein
MAVLGFGVAGASWAWSVAGVVLLAAGVTVGVLGGGLHDTHRPGLLAEEARGVVHGTTRRTVRHGDVSGPPARASRDADRRRRTVLAATAGTSAGPLAPLAGYVLVTTGLLLLAAQSPLYPMSHTGQLGSLRALGAGIVFTLSGLRVLVGAPGRHPAAACLSGAAALGLLLGAVMLKHQSDTAPVVEGLGGVIGLLACAVFLASPKTPLQQARPEPQVPRDRMRSGARGTH